MSAAEAFARPNNWRYTDKMFAIGTFVRGAAHDRRDPMGPIYDVRGMYNTDLCDHPLFFRELAQPYRPIAIVGQPYNTTPETAHTRAAEFGLKCHVPPNYLASWWYPSWTRFFVFTRPEIERVQLLPEQMREEATTIR